MAGFNKRSTAEQVTEGIDLSGKQVVITGANTGIGKETARVLALRGAVVTMACRNLHKAEEARDDILAGSDGRIKEAQLVILPLDLGSLSSVREAAAKYCERGVPLDILINNAGVWMSDLRLTEDGFESDFGINQLGHFLFSQLLLKPLRAAPSARLVVLSSSAQNFSKLSAELADPNWQQRKYRSAVAYGDSKLMNLMFAREWNRRYGDEGIPANAVHPGVIATELGRDLGGLFKLVGVVALPFMKTVGQGAATSCFVATDPHCGRSGGDFYLDCHSAKMHKLAKDADACRHLWALSEKMTGLA
jgi:NAD(P)-dependent dehydrogenase (short-subunit alcohol dehydrogenase family)